MVAFIISTVFLVASICLMVYNYLYTKNPSNNIDLRIKRYIVGGFEIFLFGTAVVSLSIFGSKNLDIDVKPAILVTSIIVAIIVYIAILILWNNVYNNIQKYFTKKANVKQGYRLKSISIYGLVYAFGILFYLLYVVVLFK